MTTQEPRFIQAASARPAIAPDGSQSRLRGLNGYLSKLVDYRPLLNFRDALNQKEIFKKGLLASPQLDKGSPVGVLIKEAALTCVVDKKVAANKARKPRQLRAPARAHQIAFDLLVAQNGPVLQSAAPRVLAFGQMLCTQMQGFSQRVALRCGANNPPALGQLGLYITCPTPASKRMQCDRAGRVAPKPNTL